MTDEHVYTEGDYFETRFPYDESKNLIWDIVGDFLDEHYGIDGTVVDVGAGYGYFLNGIEADTKLAIDHSRYPLAKTEPDVESLTGDVTDIPLSDGAADVLMASNVLEHLTTEDIQVALSEFRRVLGEDGTLFIITPNFALAPRKYFDDFTHKSVLTHRSVSDLLDLSGFKKVDSVIRFLPFSSQQRLPVRQWLVRLYLALPFSPFAGQSLFVAKPKQASRRAGTQTNERNTEEHE